MNWTSSKHFGPIAEAALGEAYSAENVHYELAFADAEEHRLSIGRFLMGSDYDAVPRQAMLEGFDPLRECRQDCDAARAQALHGAQLGCESLLLRRFKSIPLVF